MTKEELLKSIGGFSKTDIELFETYAVTQKIEKNEALLKSNEICDRIHFVKKGAFIEINPHNEEAQIIELFIRNDWVFNLNSLTSQTASKTNIVAYIDSEIITISLLNFHKLSSYSNSFLQFGKILNQPNFKSELYDNCNSPIEKYELILIKKPALLNHFPLKLIASYLKISPETLSRVRSKF